MGEDTRIDKWLWAIRLFKTRTEAADACRAGRVHINGALTKPSRAVAAGNVVTVRKTMVTFAFRVIEPVANRQPAKNVPLYAENITPQEELDKLSVPRETLFISRDRGTGRPTKKERREIDAAMGGLWPERED